MKIHLRAGLDTLAFQSHEIHPANKFELTDLANLLIRSYENTVDWIEGSTHKDAMDAIEGVIHGSYGEFQPHASGFIQNEKGIPVSGVLCSMYENEPFVVLTFTDPNYTNKGLAKRLIRHSAAQFHSLGFSSIHLYVTSNNPALHLYKNLGFLEA